MKKLACAQLDADLVHPVEDDWQFEDASVREEGREGISVE